MREIPKKNYVLLVLMVIVVVILTLGLSKLYNKRHESKYLSPMYNLLNQVKETDLDNLIIDNPTVVIYISDETDESLDEIDSQIKEFVVKNNIQSYFVYLSVSDKDHEKLNSFQKKHDLEISFHDIPTLVVLNDGQMSEKLEVVKWNEEEFYDFLVRNGVIDND